MQPLNHVVDYLETLLDHKNISDWPNALNGLQLENSGLVGKIGAAVDACEATMRMASQRGVDLLIAHHGLFWRGLQRIEGGAYRRFKMALGADLAVYSSHLPLDVHPTLGNNALLAAAIGFPPAAECEPFFSEKGRFIGLKARLELPRDELRARLERAVGGPVKLIAGGDEQTAMVGVVTGGAGGELAKALSEGVDTFITGEGPHWTFTAAEELHMNVLYAGHYATETFGVKALAEHLSEKFELPWEFLDHPSGL